jgi:restriction endonuclease S subunit
MKLGEISEIRTGLVLSRKQSKSDTGIDYHVLTLSSIEKEGRINLNTIENFKSVTELDNKLLTKQGNIIIRLSNPYTAVYIKKEYENILMPSLIASIEINSKDFLPEYIQIFLNSENCKERLRKEANGTVIVTVNTKILKELEIPELPIWKQKDLIEYENSYYTEKKLTEKLLELKEKEFQMVLEQNFEKEKY